MNKNKRAFTLAEVLISLTIIGVIAAITVPALIQRTNKQEYVSALQKAYSTLSQAANMIIAEEGSPKASDGGWAYSAENIYEKFRTHLNNVKECSSSTGCFSPGTYKKLFTNGGWNFDGLSYHKKLILAGGISVMFQSDNVSAKNNCSKTTNGSNNVCAQIWVDVNGFKKPNQYGRDFFEFVLKENGLFPAGCEADACEGTEGGGCTCKVLREGAMNY